MTMRLAPKENATRSLAATMLSAITLSLALTLAKATETSTSTPMNCAGDIEFVAAFLLENDAGVRASGWGEYPLEPATVLDQEMDVAETVTSPETCVQLLNRFLVSVRKGHLAALPGEEDASVVLGPKVPPVVGVRKLSKRTTYIEVPSFGVGIRDQLEKIVERNDADIRDADFLIIDVRNNGGGSDSAYAPLIQLLGPATYRTLMPDMLATPANIAAWEKLLPEIPERDQKRTRDRVARMKAATSEWVPMSDPSVTVTRYTKKDVKATPQSVWIMIGPKCGSSCEQFVLTARQNPRVTLVGRRTYGALDASNVRPVRTPSGKMTVYYATTCVRRPQEEKIDGVGIPPAIELAAPADDAAYAAEVTEVQRRAEEGRGKEAASTQP